MRRIGRRARVAAIPVTVLGLLLPATAADAAAPGSPVPEMIELAPPELVQAAATAPASVPLTLITGDRVHVGIDPDGQPVVRGITQADRPDGQPVSFHTYRSGPETFVVPGDALPLLADGTLDRNLFNLVELGKHAADGTLGEVPVLVEHASAARAATAAAPAGATVGRTLTSVDSTAMTIAGDGSWWQAVQAAADRTARAARAGTDPLAGVDKVWLNPLLQVNLDESVPQIAAEVAWDLGYDGTGVTVAVLDTGIDPNHPDVAGKIVEQVDFTGNAGGPVDGHGHGTHVAATIAGTGAASDGLRPGVAPGASLRVGKVCSDGGSCPGDAIIAGMEWAAQSGSPIANMSLGGGATDGTDPLSMAVNQLSAAFGILFVISAGNSGPSSYTVGAPGAADEALTVAAVDKTDEMASFSSRGPRVGDDAPKPDIAAPGVNIVAARAAGTGMGTPVDDNYTTASGTSMAAPHTAGAAAVVAQQNPELSGRELKALLMATALDLGHDLYAQGAGRVDVGRAVDPTVFSDGNVVFGRFEFPHQPVTDAITYRNLTEQPIALDIDASMTAGDGTPGPAGLITTDTDQVTVPAGGTASVEVTMDGSVLGADDVFGQYGGRVTATDAAGDLRASSRVSAFLEPERFDVTIQVTPPAGADSVSFGEVTIAAMDDQVHLHDDPAALPGGQTTTARLFSGAYAVATEVNWRDADGVLNTALAADPEVTVADASVTVELDLRDAQPVGAQAPERTETYLASFGYQRDSATGQWSIAQSVSADYQDGEQHWWALPTESVSVGTFSFASQQVQVPSLVSIEAIGGGPSLPLDPRYGTPDVSVSGGSQQWQVDEETTDSRALRLPVPRLAIEPTRLAYAGTGSSDELAAAGVDGTLVLLTPTDICSVRCSFSALQERVNEAAQLGALGVLVAGETGRVSLASPTPRTVTCPDGPDSCPPVEPYAEIPILSLPAGEAAELVDRLSSGTPVRAITTGHTELPRAYALWQTGDGQIPQQLSQQLRWRDLDRVEHRFHSDRPGEVEEFTWQPGVPTADGGTAATGLMNLPRTATQYQLPVYTGPSDDEVIHRYSATTFEYAEPFVVDSASQLAEEQDQVIDGRSPTVSWNLRPHAVGPAPMPFTDSGFTLGGSVCAGCREGDVLYPALYVTTGGGAKTSLIGMVNDAGVAGFILGTPTCEPPACEVRLFDQDGNEFEQRLQPVAVGIGADGMPSGPVPTGQLTFGATGDGVTDKETNR